MSFLKRLFGGGNGGAARGSAVEPVEHGGFRIIVDPIPEDGQYRVAATIEGEVDGETKTHRMIRADVIRDHDEAVAASLRKAKQMIDEQDARLFG
ncbi:Transcriptional activator HlyU [Roseivivax sp. THAF40]|uniref:HlyU family transcriptional regulator n=1 Tax=unclassified Roseivivax TaxID=2639302 RepID=UPI0012685842|nr:MULTISPECIES: HlyU family transcriptional regulator [unclassified Roseivivax]QFS83848.1 Transcriptional activator HlyU [Roseivivax sp. THAF197b]QFT47680.1 Transcriptional activator HlyU [Roseivivax sp. THAF40]